MTNNDQDSVKDQIEYCDSNQSSGRFASPEPPADFNFQPPEAMQAFANKAIASAHRNFQTFQFTMKDAYSVLWCDAQYKKDDAPLGEVPEEHATQINAMRDNALALLTQNLNKQLAYLGQVNPPAKQSIPFDMLYYDWGMQNLKKPSATLTIAGSKVSLDSLSRLLPGTPEVFWPIMSVLSLLEGLRLYKACAGKGGFEVNGCQAYLEAVRLNVAARIAAVNRGHYALTAPGLGRIWESVKAQIIRFIGAAYWEFMGKTLAESINSDRFFNVQSNILSTTCTADVGEIWRNFSKDMLDGISQYLKEKPAPQHAPNGSQQQLKLPRNLSEAKQAIQVEATVLLNNVESHLSDALFAALSACQSVDDASAQFKSDCLKGKKNELTALLATQNNEQLMPDAIALVRAIDQELEHLYQALYAAYDDCILPSWTGGTWAATYAAAMAQLEQVRRRLKSSLERAQALQGLCKRHAEERSVAHRQRQQALDTHQKALAHAQAKSDVKTILATLVGQAKGLILARKKTQVADAIFKQGDQAKTFVTHQALWEAIRANKAKLTKEKHPFWGWLRGGTTKTYALVLKTFYAHLIAKETQLAIGRAAGSGQAESANNARITLRCQVANEIECVGKSFWGQAGQTWLARNHGIFKAIYVKQPKASGGNPPPAPAQPFVS